MVEAHAPGVITPPGVSQNRARQTAAHDDSLIMPDGWI
jgi:hypothetical protein